MLRRDASDQLERAQRVCREAGVKFTMGTNNGGANDLGRLEYPVAMVQACGLTPGDFWFPGE